MVCVCVFFPLFSSLDYSIPIHHHHFYNFYFLHFFIHLLFCVTHIFRIAHMYIYARAHTLSIFGVLVFVLSYLLSIVQSDAFTHCVFHTATKLVRAKFFFFFSVRPFIVVIVTPNISLTVFFFRLARSISLFLFHFKLAVNFVFTSIIIYMQTVCCVYIKLKIYSIC